MTPRAQKRLAIGTALIGCILFIGANAHLLSVSLQSQPECREVPGLVAAKQAC
jgi:hypothetical protein